MKAVIALLLSLAMFFESCFIPPLFKNEDDPDNSKTVYNSGKSKSVNESSDAGPVYLTPGNIGHELFNNLDQNGRIVYSLIDEAVKEMNTEDIRVPDEMSMEQMQEAFDAYVDDCPENFWLYRSFTRRQVGAEVYIRLSYCVNSIQERDSMKEDLDSVVRSIARSALRVRDRFEKELIIHDRIIESCEYDYSAAESGYESNELSFSAYGALVAGRAVCEGYSRAMQLICHESGIQCVLLRGTAGNSRTSHMWNVVTINGSKYHVDLTWDDTGSDFGAKDNGEEHKYGSDDPAGIGQEEDVGILYYYFNLPDEIIAFDHFDFAAHNCTDTKDNYFSRKAMLLFDWDDEYADSLAEYTAGCLEDGKKLIYIAFFDEKSYNNALEYLINDEQIFKILDRAKKLSGIEIRTESLGYIMSEGPLYTVGFRIVYQ
ncbi:MAG: hypothetical protein IKS19_02255 [Clostridia bacterium]|nr:hypothetical protein [Clostridia bacterium]